MRRSAAVTWDQVRVGALVLVGLVILGGAVFLIGKTGHVFGQRYDLVTLMSSATGLAPGAAVQLAGQPVGQVDRIELIPPEKRPASGAAVAIWLAVNRDVQPQIRTDSKAHVKTQGLLGDRLIDIDPGTASAEVLAPGDTLPSAEPLDYQEILEDASGAVGSLTRLTASLDTLTRQMLSGEGTMGQLIVDRTLYDRMVGLSGSLDTLLRAATSRKSFLGKMLRDDRLYDELTSALSGLDSLTSGMAAGRGTLGRLFVSDSLYDALQGTAEATDSLLARLQSGEGSAGKLLTDQRLYEELLKTVVQLNATLEELRQNPKKYVPPVKVF